MPSCVLFFHNRQPKFPLHFPVGLMDEHKEEKKKKGKRTVKAKEKQVQLSLTWQFCTETRRPLELFFNLMCSF